MLVSAASEDLPQINRHFRAMVVWMHEDPLVVGKTYVAKHTTRTVRATVRAIRHRVDVGTLDQVQASRLEMNEIAEVEFETSLPLFFDSYAENRGTGALILIDGVTNATVGACMIIAAMDTSSDTAARTVLVWVPEQKAVAEQVLEALQLRGERAVLVDDALIPDAALTAAVRALQLAGVVAVTARTLNVDTLAQIEDFAEDGVLLGEGRDADEILRLAGASE
jgi:bifunctional enzyme CysN/CysC/sulfate adenylyltransferase subunit 1